MSHDAGTSRRFVAAHVAVTVGGVVVSGAIGFPNHAFAGSSGVYQTTPNVGPANNAQPVAGGSSIAIGINANASSPSGSGDAIAIGTDVFATNQDSIAIGAQTAATGTNTIAIGNNAAGAALVGTQATGNSAIAFGVNSVSSGYGSVTFGNSSTASANEGVALGFGSMALRQGLSGGSEAFSGQTVNSDYGAVSVGVAGAERQITNVAGGTQDTDAVNIRQLRDVGNDVAQDGLGGGAGFNSTSYVYTPPTFTVGRVNYNNVASALTATNNLSVQYTPDGSGNPTNVVDLTKNGSLSPVLLTGLAPATVASGAVSLSQLPLQYSTSGAPTTANPAAASNDVTLVGSNSAQSVVIHNVGVGALNATSTDAVDGSQLFSTNQNVANLRGSLTTVGLVQQDATTRNITVAAYNDGTAVDFTNSSGTARTLIGIGTGQIASGSTQGVNGGQIYNTAVSVARNFGGGSGVNTDGTISAPTYNVQGGSYSDVGGALGVLNTAVTNINTNGSRYVATNSTAVPASATGADGLAVGPNASTTSSGGVALGANAVASRAGLGGATEDFSGTNVASTAGAVSVGTAGAERQITNVAGGTAATDAVNVRQLTAVGTQVATALGGGATLAPNGALIGPTYSVDGTTYNNVGGAVAALDNTGVKYDVDATTGARGNSVTLQGGDPNQPVLIHNVATGQAASDAANTGQVVAAKEAAFAYTDRSVAIVDNQINNLNGQISDLQTQVGQVRTEGYQAAAIGLAASSLRYDDRPGKLSTSVGTGFWQGQTATAMGLGYTLPDGRARVNASAVTAGHDFGFGAGASITLN